MNGPSGEGLRKSKRLRGGVNALRAVAAPAAAAGPAHGDLVWNGGPVITRPDVFPTFWGAKWSDSVHQDQAARLVKFLGDLIASDYMNILTQYGVGTGGQVRAASFLSGVAGTLSDGGIQMTIQKAVTAGTLPEPPSKNQSQVVIIFLDESVEVKDSALGIVMCEPKGDNAFGYHSGFTTAASNSCYYSVIPALDDACIKNSCPSGGCSLDIGQTQEQRRTQVVSHELSEMATDPQFGTGWYGPTSDEIGDICNGQSAIITVGSDDWNVQMMYSKADDVKSDGASYCISGSAQPIPPLPNGPPQNK